MSIARRQIDRYSAGRLLQDWRKRRRLSQLELALTAEVSPKHVSFLETGRAQPSRDMLLHLAQHLQIPPREQNTLLASAGFAPAFPETPIGEAAFDDARRVIELILRGHEPYPAIAIDRHWNVVLQNQAVAPLLANVDVALLTPPVNVLRLSLHPGGLARDILNLAEWREHLLLRLRQQISVTGDPVLIDLMREVSAYPHPANENKTASTHRNLAVPLSMRSPFGVLRFFSTTMIFGSPVDITLSELAIETFMPADAQTAAIVKSA